MRITFQCSTVETLEYLRIVNTVLRSNRDTDETIKAFNTLKGAIESIDARLGKLEDANIRRNKVCR